MSSDQQTNKRSTRLRSAMENKISTMPNKPEPGKMEESVQQLQGMKRRADINLAKHHHGVKRFALGNLTNAESDNLQAQQPIASQIQKASIPTAKANPANDSKVAGAKSKGVTKILTRAAMRLVRNGKKQQDEQEKQDPNRKETAQSSSLSADFVKINVAVGAVPKPETAPPTAATSGKEVPKLIAIKKQQKHPSQAPGVCRDEKKAIISGTLDVQPRARLSNDFELSDNSLYVTAFENLEEENVASTSTKGTAAGKGGKPEVQIKKQAPKLPVKAKNGSENVSEQSCSTVGQNPIIPCKPEAPMKTKELASGVSNQPLDEAGNAKIKNQKMSGELELSDGDLYVSAMDALGAEGSGSAPALLVGDQAKLIPGTQLNTGEKGIQDEELVRKSTLIASCAASSTTKNDVVARRDTDQPQSPPKRTPPGVEDFDKTYWNDIHQVSEYAQDIFEYLRERESAYVVQDYMKSQPHLSCYMRSLLVDWMVEIQESFELNHETLYLGVKIVDAYLSLVVIGRELLQLVAAAALLIAAKYDERVPPTVDDFIYICDGAYSREELLTMERTVFRTIGFDIGFPLSYRFLRRYARVNRVPMHILTLARYILETSLMDYATVVLADSKLACAALFIALRMYDQPGWNKGLEFYSGYTVNDFKDIVVLLNNGIWPRKSPLYKLTSVREKYSHDLFFNVAKRPVIFTLAKLFDTTDVEFKVPAAVSAQSMAQRISTEENKTVAP